MLAKSSAKIDSGTSRMKRIKVMSIENLRGWGSVSETILLSLNSYYFLQIYPELSRHVLSNCPKGRFAHSRVFPQAHGKKDIRKNSTDGQYQAESATPFKVIMIIFHYLIASEEDFI
jgi:hypothetical protein